VLLIRALFALFLYDILSSFRPFNTIYSRVRGWKVAEKPVTQGAIDRVWSAVDYACLLYPKHALCLQRSFADTYLLRTQGIPARMVLGAQKLPFRAHAWVEVNGQPVNERSDVQAIYEVWERC